MNPMQAPNVGVGGKDHGELQEEQNSAVERLVSLTMTIEQARTLRMACETMSRLFMGQMDVLDLVCDADRDTLDKVKQLCFPELHGPGHSYGINNKNISDEARQLWDFNQVIRHHLSWRDQPNTPSTRDWKTQMTVNYDDPMKSSEQPLPIISEG